MQASKSGNQLLSDTEAKEMETEKYQKSFVTEMYIEVMNPVELNIFNYVAEQIEHVKNGCVAIYLKVTAILVMLLGLVVAVLNIIFIYFGINSDWYSGNIANLRVISVGEGFISGVFYIIISWVLLIYLSKNFASALRILCNVFLLVIGITLIIVNSCQIVMVQTFFHNSFKEDQIRQMALLGVQMLAHMFVLVIAAADLLGVTKLCNLRN